MSVLRLSFVFFKQKTAYEMRISDWSSDVCSSDLIAAPLSDADATLQPHPDASPAKWHLAHTSWFFETFVLRDHVAGYRLYDERWPFLFNSYYQGEGERHARPRRGMISRPSLDEILAYRDHVDGAVAQAVPGLGEDGLGLVELGLNHRSEHERLMLPGILATVAEHPLDRNDTRQNSRHYTAA